MHGAHIELLQYYQLIPDTVIVIPDDEVTKRNGGGGGVQCTYDGSEDGEPTKIIVPQSSAIAGYIRIGKVLSSVSACNGLLHKIKSITYDSNGNIVINPEGAAPDEVFSQLNVEVVDGYIVPGLGIKSGSGSVGFNVNYRLDWEGNIPFFKYVRTSVHARKEIAIGSSAHEYLFLRWYRAE